MKYISNFAVQINLVVVYAKICYVFCGKVKFYSSPHLWLELVLSLALQIKKSV